MTLSRIAALATAVVLAVQLVACDPPRDAEAPTSQAQPIESMAFETRASSLPEGFPVEIPVPAGAILAAESQGGDVWYYREQIAASAAQAADWYQKAFSAANWVVLKSVPVDGGGFRILLGKGNAQTDVLVTPEGEDSCEVEVTTGLGVPVGQTQ